MKLKRKIHAVLQNDFLFHQHKVICGQRGKLEKMGIFSFSVKRTKTNVFDNGAAGVKAVTGIVFVDDVRLYANREEFRIVYALVQQYDVKRAVFTCRSIDG